MKSLPAAVRTGYGKQVQHCQGPKKFLGLLLHTVTIDFIVPATRLVIYWPSNGQSRLEISLKMGPTAMTVSSSTHHFTRTVKYRPL